jgi:hypothetical protein
MLSHNVKAPTAAALQGCDVLTCLLNQSGPDMFRQTHRVLEAGVVGGGRLWEGHHNPLSKLRQWLAQPGLGRAK